MLTRLLHHPLTRGLDIDAPETTHLRRQIVCEKRFLRRLYEDWYAALRAAVPAGPGAVLELGSGGGFLREVIPDLVTSDVFPVPGVDQVVDAHELPFEDGALRAVLMTNVLHHLADVRRFFREAARCVRPGGVMALVEPWNTPWSRFVYRHFHYEPFDPATASWTFPATGPLSGANNALPWILFARDRERFLAEFPQWRIETVRPIMPFRYLLSGGVGFRSLMPGWTYPACKAFEACLSPWRNYLAMFAHVVLVRTEE